jgi:hypothetical protein
MDFIKKIKLAIQSCKNSQILEILKISKSLNEYR